jgi:hypothetical protein
MAKSETRSTLQDTDIKVKSANLLKSNGVKVDSEGGVKFIIPPNIEQMIQKTFGFSATQLSVGGSIALADLAIHCDEQASTEFHISGLCEYYRYLLKVEEDKFEIWYNQTLYKCRKYLMTVVGEKAPTEKTIVGRVMVKYGKEYVSKREVLNKMEFEYRLLNNVIRSSVITKGTMLPTLRNIVQGKNDGIELGFKGNEKLRNAIKLKIGEKK